MNERLACHRYAHTGTNAAHPDRSTAVLSSIPWGSWNVQPVDEVRWPTYREF